MSVEVRVPASPAGDAPTTPSDVSTTPKLRRADPEMLVCTYGRRTISDSVMASDGLCDIAFFDSIYAGNKNNLSGGSPFDSDLETFMRAATRYNRTTLGISFAFHHMYQLRDDLRRTKPNALEVFWRSRIYHTGILDTPTGATQTEMMTAMLRLKVLADLAKRQRAPRRSVFTALAAPSPARQWIHYFDEEFKRIQFIPDLLVVYGHYPFGDNTVDNCAVMPPTQLSAVRLPHEFQGSYVYDMSYGPHGIRELERRRVPTAGLVSVTMKGRWTTPSPGRPLEFFERCERDPGATSFGSYTEVCRGQGYLRYEPQHYAMLAYETTNRTLFAYDNEEGLAAKLCRVKNEVLDVNFGIAAYDVDYDDYANECRMMNKLGAHSRLKVLRKILDYYRSLASQIFNETSCARVAS
ncbi:uncharacterized protein LOC144100198 [Amblyomma americanum]